MLLCIIHKNLLSTVYRRTRPFLFGDRWPLQLLSSHSFCSWSRVASKSREIASLVRNDFGNIAALKDSLDETQGDEGVSPGGTRTLGTRQLRSSPKYGSDDDCSSATSGSTAYRITGSPDHAQASGFDAVLHEIRELRDNQAQLEDSFENLKAYYQQNHTVIMEALQEEQYRGDLVEEKLSDLTELHQNEIGNLKEELASMEEKIAYQSYDGATDIHEALQACQTRLFKMELQQVQLEGLENATARTLLGKLINMLLAVMAFLLLMVSTVANCVVPLMKTYGCMLSTLLFVVLFSFLWRHKDATSEYLHHFFCTQHPE